jgi:hypothetical protein
MRGIPRTGPYPHGTKPRYSAGCRCQACREAKSRYERSLRRRNAYGRSPWVDAGPIRRYVRKLMAPRAGSSDGIGWRRIAMLAGVNEQVVRQLLYGRGGGCPRSRRIHLDHAKALLAVKPGHYLRAPGATTDSRASVQLVECMVRSGFSRARVARNLGDRRPNPGIRLGERITVRRAGEIAALHWRLWEGDMEYRRGCECPLPHEVETRLREAS